MHSYTFPFAFILLCDPNQLTLVTRGNSKSLPLASKLECDLLHCHARDHCVPGNERILYKHTLVFSNQVFFQPCFGAWRHSHPALPRGSGLAGSPYHQISAPMNTGCRVHSEILMQWCLQPLEGSSACTSATVMIVGPGEDTDLMYGTLSTTETSQSETWGSKERGNDSSQVM